MSTLVRPKGLIGLSSSSLLFRHLRRVDGYGQIEGGWMTHGPWTSQGEVWSGHTVVTGEPFLLLNPVVVLGSDEGWGRLVWTKP